MKIDFQSLPLQHLAAFKGGEGEYLMRGADDGKVKIMLGRLRTGHSIGLHCHEGSSECIYLIAGELEVRYEGEAFMLQPGEAHYCPEGHSHSIVCRSQADAVFFAVVPQVAV